MNKSIFPLLAVTGTLLNHPAVLSAASSDVATTISAENCQTALLMAVPATTGATTSACLLKLIFNANADIRDRLQAVQFLRHDLSAQEIGRLYHFLKNQPDSREKNLAGLRALKNDLINALKDQTVPPAGLTATLIDIYRDQDQDFVTRDYAIQHLTRWYSRGANDSPDAKARIRAVLKEGILKKTSIAGTALLGLHRLSAGDPNIDGGVIDKSALRMATSSETGVAARVTAVQICGERRIYEALPEIERFAQARGHTALQISAIAALGTLGGVQQTGLLRRLEMESDGALRPAITAALRRLPRTLANQGPL